MRGLNRGVRSCQETLKHLQGADRVERSTIFLPFGWLTSSSPSSHPMQVKGFENVTVANVLMTKGEEKFGSWLWCTMNDTVYDAVKNVAQNKIGSLVVLKPGEQQHIAGIITKRDHHIRHVPVIDGKIVGMISIVVVVRAMEEQQSKTKAVE